MNQTGRKIAPLSRSLAWRLHNIDKDVSSSVHIWTNTRFSIKIEVKWALIMKSRCRKEIITLVLPTLSWCWIAVEVLENETTKDLIIKNFESRTKDSRPINWNYKFSLPMHQKSHRTQDQNILAFYFNTESSEQILKIDELKLISSKFSSKIKGTKFKP